MRGRAVRQQEQTELVRLLGDALSSRRSKHGHTLQCDHRICWEAVMSGAVTFSTRRGLERLWAPKVLATLHGCSFSS
jgi:hypothetical protein